MKDSKSHQARRDGPTINVTFLSPWHGSPVRSSPPAVLPPSNGTHSLAFNKEHHLSADSSSTRHRLIATLLHCVSAGDSAVSTCTRAPANDLPPYRRPRIEMANKKTKRGKKAASKPDDVTTYLGFNVTYWELEHLNIKHQVHASILHEHGLVNQFEKSEAETAMPMVDGERILPGDAQDEMSMALNNFKPTGPHLESEEWMDNPYAWTRRGVKGKLVIKRLSKVRKGELVGKAAMAIWGKDKPEKDHSPPEPTKEEKRHVSEALPESENETILVLSDVEKAIDIAFDFVGQNPDANALEILNPPPMRDPRIINSVPSKSKSARLAKARLASERMENIPQNNLKSRIAGTDEPPTKRRKIERKRRNTPTERRKAPTRKVGTHQGHTLAKSDKQNAKRGQRLQPKEVKPNDNVRQPQTHPSVPNTQPQNKYAGRVELKEPSMPGEVGVADIEEEKHPLVDFPPAASGRSIGEAHEVMDGFVTSDVHAAFEAGIERLRLAALNATSPLSSHGLDPIADPMYAERDTVDLKCAPTASGEESAEVYPSITISSPNIAEQKDSPEPAKVKALMCSSTMPKAASLAEEDRAYRTQRKSRRVRSPSPLTTADLDDSAAAPPPPYGIPQEVREVNSLLKELLFGNPAETEASAEVRGVTGNVSRSKKRKRSHAVSAVPKQKE